MSRTCRSVGLLESHGVGRAKEAYPGSAVRAAGCPFSR